MNFLAIKNSLPKDVGLVAVSKNASIDSILEAYNLGCRDFGENRALEALEKIAVLPKDIRWHLVGPLQRKKVAKVIGKFHLIHSVDSLDLAKEIGARSASMGIVTSVLLQVKLSPEKRGFTPEELYELFDILHSIQSIDIKGFMTMAPFTENENLIRSCFSILKRLQEKLSVKKQLNILSMGMSGDYKIALECGSTLVRIGSAIFGQ